MELADARWPDVEAGARRLLMVNAAAVEAATARLRYEGRTARRRPRASGSSPGSPRG